MCGFGSGSDAAGGRRARGAWPGLSHIPVWECGVHTGDRKTYTALCAVPPTPGSQLWFPF